MISDICVQRHDNRISDKYVKCSTTNCQKRAFFFLSFFLSFFFSFFHSFCFVVVVVVGLVLLCGLSILM